MAADNSGVKGGVVDLQTIITQIQSITAGLEAIVDACKASSNGVMMAIRVKLAKHNIKNSSKQIIDLLDTFEVALKELGDQVGGKDYSSDFNKLISGSSILLDDSKSNEDKIKAVTGGQAVGAFDYVLGFISLIEEIGDADIPNPISLMFKMIKLKMAVSIVSKAIPDIILDITMAGMVALTESPLKVIVETLKDAIQLVMMITETNFPSHRKLNRKIKSLRSSISIVVRGIRSIVNVLSRMATQMAASLPQVRMSVLSVELILASIGRICKLIIRLSWLTAITILFMPFTIMGIFIISIGIRLMVMSLRILGNPAQYRLALIVTRSVRRLLFVIFRCLRRIALVFVMILLIVAICILTGQMIIKFFGPFLIGILTILGMLIFMVGVLWVMSIAAKFAANVSRTFIINFLLVGLTLILMALIIWMISFMADRVVEHIDNIITMLLLMGALMLGVLAFMVIVAFISEGLAIGLAAIGLVIVVLLAILILVFVLILITKVAEQIDPEHVKESVKGIIECVFSVVSALLEASFDAFKTDENKADEGFLGKLMSFAGSAFMSILGLIVKVAILALAIVALTLILILTMVMIAIVKVYEKYQNEIEQAPTVVGTVIDKCAEIIQKILGTNMSNPMGNAGDGLLVLLVSYINPELGAIVKLLLRVVIVLLTIVALALIWFLCMEIIWLYDYIHKDGNYAKLSSAPATIQTIMNKCSEVIQSVLGATVGTSMEAADGALIAIVAFISPEMASILKLVWRIIIVALTLLVLALVKFLCENILELHETYAKGTPGGNALNEAPTTIQTIIQTCANIIKTILTTKPEGEAESADGIYLTLIGWIFGEDIKNILGLMFKIIIIGMTLIVLAMLKCLLNYLNEIYEEYDHLGGEGMLKKVGDMVDNIIKTINVVIAKICTAGDDPDGKPKSGLAALLDWLGFDTLATIIDLLCSFLFIGLAIMALSVLMSAVRIMGECYDTYIKLGGDNIVENVKKMTIGLIDGINAIIQTMKSHKVDFDEDDDDETSWLEEMALKAIKAIIGNNVDGIVEVLKASQSVEAAIVALDSIDVVGKVLSGTYSVLQRNILRVALIRKSYKLLADQLRNMINDIKKTDIGKAEEIENNLQQIVNVISKITKTFNKLIGDKGDAVLSTLVQQQAQYAKVVASTEKMVNKINQLNLDKLKTLATLFGHAAAFSQSIHGNFDRLAGVIREEIGPMLKDLHKVISDAKDVLKEYNTSVKKSAEELKSAMKQGGFGGGGGHMGPGYSNNSTTSSGGTTDTTSSGGTNGATSTKDPEFDLAHGGIDNQTEWKYVAEKFGVKDGKTNAKEWMEQLSTDKDEKLNSQRIALAMYNALMIFAQQPYHRLPTR